MLSEHETLELLEQLKQGVLPGATGGLVEDTVSHWPILTGGGLYLNLQTVAALELNRQPETVGVSSTELEIVNASELGTRYNQIHHLKAGHGGIALVIGYEHNFSSMLALLQETDFHSKAESQAGESRAGLDSCYTENKDTSSREYEFSQAMAASIDPWNSGQQVTLSLFTSDIEELHLSVSWRLKLKQGNLQSEFFVGLCESSFNLSLIHI